MVVDEGPTLDANAFIDFSVEGFGKTYHQVVLVIDNTSWLSDESMITPLIATLQYEYRAEVAPITIKVTSDKRIIYNKSDHATCNVSTYDDAQQLFDPNKLDATLTSPNGVAQSVNLTRVNTGTHTYLVPLDH